MTPKPTIPASPLGPSSYDPAWDEIKYYVYGGERQAMYYDRENIPISLRDWVRGTESAEYRNVACTDVGNSTIITNWIGIDIDCNPGEPPRIFGTIKIQHGNPETFHNEETDITEANAMLTHNKRVSELKADEDP